MALPAVARPETGLRRVRRHGRSRMAAAVNAGRLDISAWTAAGPPVTPPDPLDTCLVPACGLWARPGGVFCHAHASAWSLHGRPDPAGFAAGYGDEARLSRDRISLRSLSPQLRLEWQ